MHIWSTIFYFYSKGPHVLVSPRAPEMSGPALAATMAVPSRLAAVPEENPNVFNAVLPPHNLFRDSIRSVAVSGPQIRSTPFPFLRSSHNESGNSSDSGASSSHYPSNNTGSSPCLASAAATQFSAQELTRIARRMVTDGYVQRMVQEFEHGGGPDRRWRLGSSSSTSTGLSKPTTTEAYGGS